MSAPYRSTPEFTELTLPAALRAEHTTKDGVWGVIRVLEGALRYTELEPSFAEHLLTPDRPGLIRPGARHFVTALGPMRMRVEFHHSRPEI